MTDGRGRVGMRTAQAEGLGKEPDTLEAGCEFWGLPGVWWLEPGPRQDMKF